jgi:hypothetical protein
MMKVSSTVNYLLVLMAYICINQYDEKLFIMVAFDVNNRIFHLIFIIIID